MSFDGLDLWRAKQEAAQKADTARASLRAALGNIENLRRQLAEADARLVVARKEYDDAAKADAAAVEAWVKEQRDLADARQKRAAALLIEEPGGAS